MVVASAITITKVNLFKDYFNNYATKTSEEKFGARHLSSEHVSLINSIAAEMGITEPIEIRKMNSAALRTFGYCNAFVYFPSILNLIPIEKPFMFFSEGFFEDLSPEEQRFLIGHELVHAKERHLIYTSLIVFLVMLTTLCFAWYIFKNRIFRNAIAQNFPKLTHQTISIINIVLIWVWIQIVSSLTYAINMAYRRKIEREADCTSLAILNSHEGGLKMIERWKTFSVPNSGKLNNILGCHPTHEERKIFCLNNKAAITKEKR